MTLSFGFACLCVTLIFFVMDILDLKSRVLPWSLVSLSAFGFSVLLNLFGFMYPLVCGDKRWFEFDSEHKRDIGAKAMVVSMFILFLR
jgi:hypothetical protein